MQARSSSTSRDLDSYCPDLNTPGHSFSFPYGSCKKKTPHQGSRSQSLSGIKQRGNRKASPAVGDGCKGSLLKQTNGYRPLLMVAQRIAVRCEWLLDSLFFVSDGCSIRFHSLLMAARGLCSCKQIAADRGLPTVNALYRRPCPPSSAAKALLPLFVILLGHQCQCRLCRRC
jgi:hypothetical protein